MLKKIIGIVLVVIGAGLGFLLFRDDGNKVKASMMKDAVYAENGKVLPANEGKVAIFPNRRPAAWVSKYRTTPGTSI